MAFEGSKPDSQNQAGARAESNVHPNDKGNEQTFRRVAGSGTGEGRFQDQQHHGEQYHVGCAGQSEGGRISTEGVQDLSEIRNRLERSAAIRDLGRNTMAFVLADSERYVRWHIERFGCRPAGF